MPSPIAGIYIITNKITGKIYIGSSHNLLKRKNNHFTNLKNKKHQNFYLQNAWNKYGEQTFEWEIVEIVKTIVI